MRKGPAAIAIAALALMPLAARAQEEEGGEDEKRLSSDAPEPGEKVPKKHKKKAATAEEDLVEEKQPESLMRLDDPHYGFSVEAALSLAFLSKTNGPGLAGNAGIGLRVDWSVGRLWTDPTDEFWKYALLAELAYDYVGQSDGTQSISTSGGYHFINVRGLLGYPVKDFFLAYAALGGGLTVQSVSYDVQGTQTGITGTKPDLDYGLGARFRFAVNPSLSISARLELMRFRRGYLDDTFVTLGAGADF